MGQRLESEGSKNELPHRFPHLAGSCVRHVFRSDGRAWCKCHWTGGCQDTGSDCSERGCGLRPRNGDLTWRDGSAAHRPAGRLVGEARPARAASGRGYCARPSGGERTAQRPDSRRGNGPVVPRCPHPCHRGVDPARRSGIGIHGSLRCNTTAHRRRRVSVPRRETSAGSSSPCSPGPSVRRGMLCSMRVGQGRAGPSAIIAISPPRRVRQ